MTNEGSTFTIFDVWIFLLLLIDINKRVVYIRLLGRRLSLWKLRAAVALKQFDLGLILQSIMVIDLTDSRVTLERGHLRLVCNIIFHFNLCKVLRVSSIHCLSPTILTASLLRTFLLIIKTELMILYHRFY